MAAIHGRDRSGGHFFCASDYVCHAHTASRISSLFLPSTNHSAHLRLRLFTYTRLYLEAVATNLNVRFWFSVFKGRRNMHVYLSCVLLSLRRYFGFFGPFHEATPDVLPFRSSEAHLDKSTNSTIFSTIKYREDKGLR